MQQLRAEFAKLEARANGAHRGFLAGVQFVGGRRIAEIERIFRGVERLLPAFEKAVANHPFDERTRNLRQFQNLCDGKRAALGLEKPANTFFLFRARRWTG